MLQLSTGPPPALHTPLVVSGDVVTMRVSEPVSNVLPVSQVQDWMQKTFTWAKDFAIQRPESAAKTAQQHKVTTGNANGRIHLDASRIASPPQQPQFFDR